MNRSSVRMIFFFSAVFAFTAFVSFYCLSTSPGFWFDEGIFYQITRNWAEQGIRGVQLAPGTYSDFSLISVGYPVFYPAVLVFRVFGAGVIELRLVAAAFLLGSVFSFAALSARLYAHRIALLSTAVLAVFAPLYGNGKSFLGEVPGMFFLFLGAYILAKIERMLEQKTVQHPFFLYGLSGVSGVLFGFSIAAKPLFILVLPALALAIALKWRVFLGTRRGRIATAAGLSGVLIALILWFVTQFGLGASPARIFTHYANPYYFESFLPIILSNLKRFFTESTPILFLLQFFAAAYYLVRRYQRNKPVTAAELTVFAFAALVAVAYLRTYGWYRYFFPGHLALFLFTIPGAAQFWEDIRKFAHFSVFREPMRLTMLFALLFAAVQMIPLSNQALSCTIDAPTLARPHIRELNSDRPVLFYSVPHVAALYTGNAGYQYIRMSDQLQLGAEQAQRLNENFFHTVVIEERMAETGVLPDCFRLQNSADAIQFYTRDPEISCQ